MKKLNHLKWSEDARFNSLLLLKFLLAVLPSAPCRQVFFLFDTLSIQRILSIAFRYNSLLHFETFLAWTSWAHLDAHWKHSFNRIYLREKLLKAKIIFEQMNSTSTTAAIITTTLSPIQMITARTQLCGSIAIILIGVIGCILNFITFTAPRLSNNSCAFYFLVSTIFELLSFTFGLLSTFSINIFGSTLLRTSRLCCKLQAYLACSLPLIATYLILLSSIDRCMSSSGHANWEHSVKSR